jgi:hypothetical protein
MAKTKTENSVKAKSLFDHLAGIKEKKVKWDTLSEMDKKSFEPYMINRFLSMNIDLLPIINILQKYTIGDLTPKEVYKLYLDFLPKEKSFDKYIKGKSEDKHNKELLKYLSMWYGVSEREVIDYLELLPKDEVLKIVMKYGKTEKEAKTLLK